jgi:large-conductance mechanosensitive channel
MSEEVKYIKTPEGQPDKLEMKAQVKSGKMKGRKVTVLLDADAAMNEAVMEQAKGFVDFLREHAIVGLAIGFVVGTQAQTVVRQLIESFITPTINLIIGGAALDKRTFYLNLFHNGQSFAWGKMVLVLVNLFVVLATIYTMVKILNLDKLEKKQ